MDHFVINARPQPINVNPYNFTLNAYNSSVPTIVLTGRSFFNITNIYLSAYNSNILNQPQTYKDPFSKSSRLSSLFLGFSGLEVTNYAKVISNKIITLELPNFFNDSGYFDIIVQNEAGYGILSNDSRVPFLSTYNGAIDIQRPCVNGVSVNNYVQLSSELDLEGGVQFLSENNLLFVSEG